MSRINRQTYWIGVVLILAVILLGSTLTGGPPVAVGCLVALILLGPARLHDFGMSGWYVLVPVVPALALLAVANYALVVPFLGPVGLADLLLLAGVAVIGAIPARTAINRFGPKQRPQSRGRSRR